MTQLDKACFSEKHAGNKAYIEEGITYVSEQGTPEIVIDRKNGSFLIREEVGLEEAIALIVEDIIHVDIIFEGLLSRGDGHFTLEGGVTTLGTRVFVGNEVVQLYLERQGGTYRTIAQMEGQATYLYRGGRIDLVTPTDDLHLLGFAPAAKAHHKGAAIACISFFLFDSGHYHFPFLHGLRKDKAHATYVVQASILERL